MRNYASASAVSFFSLFSTLQIQRSLVVFFLPLLLSTHSAKIGISGKFYDIVSWLYVAIDLVYG